jgi:hypothetical protein
VSFKVDPPALDDFARSCERRQAAFHEITGQLTSAEVPAGSFGRIPVISDRIHEAYHEHHQRCLDGLKSVDEAMWAIATAMHNTAQHYRETDQDAHDDLQEFHKQFDGITVKGLKK